MGEYYTIINDRIAGWRILHIYQRLDGRMGEREALCAELSLFPLRREASLRRVIPVLPRVHLPMVHP